MTFHCVAGLPLFDLVKLLVETRCSQCVKCLAGDRHVFIVTRVGVAAAQGISTAIAGQMLDPRVFQEPFTSKLRDRKSVV